MHFEYVFFAFDFNIIYLTISAFNLIFNNQCLTTSSQNF